MDNKQESWKDVFSVPAIVAIIGAVILLAGTFMEVGRFSLFGLNYPFDLHDLSLDLIQLGGQGIQLRLDHGTGLIHQVNGLIRQESVGYIPV